MIGRLFGMFRRRSKAHADGHADEQEQTQREQFDQWESVMQEVERVQAVAERRKVKRLHVPERRHAHR